MNEELLKKIKAIEPSFKPPKCKLVGRDGNAFSVMGFAKQALQKAGYVSLKDLYFKEATAGDYDNLLYVTSVFCKVS